jgi:hypothetical protein
MQAPPPVVTPLPPTVTQQVQMPTSQAEKFKQEQDLKDGMASSLGGTLSTPSSPCNIPLRILIHPILDLMSSVTHAHFYLFILQPLIAEESLLHHPHGQSAMHEGLGVMMTNAMAIPASMAMPAAPSGMLMMGTAGTSNQVSHSFYTPFRYTNCQWITERASC